MAMRFRWLPIVLVALSLPVGFASAQDADDDGFPNASEINSYILCPPVTGRRLTNPWYSRSPLIQRSLVLDGTAITIPDPDAPPRFGLDAWTVECWIMPTSTVSGAIIERVTGAGNTNFALVLENNRPSAQFTDTLIGQQYIAGGSVGGAPAIPLNQWTHLAGSWDPENFTLALYVNGSAYEALIVWGLADNGAGTATLGRGIYGYVDEVRIWGDVRTADEIADNLHVFGAESVTAAGPVDDLVAFYPFDDGGTNVEDFANMIFLDPVGSWTYGLLNSNFTAAVHAEIEGDIDDDADGLPDWWEGIFWPTPPVNVNPLGILGAAGADTDGDGLANLTEYLLDLNPRARDTDNDRIPDGVEDSDGDGLSNGEEMDIFSTDPADPDTDDDGYSDGAEVNPLISSGGEGLTSPRYSRSPLEQASLRLTNGVAIEVPDDGRFDLRTWTVECWVRLATSNETGNIISRIVGGERTNFCLRVDANIPSVQFTSEGGVTFRASADFALLAGEWTHLAGIWDPDRDTLRLYANGVPLSAQMCLQECSSGPGSVWIGGTINGNIDEGRAWQVPRSSSDIGNWANWLLVNTRTIGGGNRVVDLVFVLDGTGSMADDIDAISTNIDQMTHEIEAAGVSLQLGGVVFRDSLTPGSPDPDPSGEGMFADADTFVTGFLNPIIPSGGMGVGADSLGGLVYALNPANFSPTYRAGAQKVFVLVTDEQVIDTEDGDPGAVNSRAGVIAQLVANNVTVHAVFNPAEADVGELATGTGGLSLDITSSDWSSFLEAIAGAIVESVSGVGTSQTDLVAYYTFDDGENTGITNALTGLVDRQGAEDYANPLNWDYALQGVTASMFDKAEHPEIYGMYDYDGDGIEDWWEDLFFTGVPTGDKYDDFFPGDADPAGDEDGDGLLNRTEYYCQTNPRDLDSNDDGTPDGLEDFDNDGLVNVDEQDLYGTDPRLPDTDDDGLSDLEELLNGTDPSYSEDPPEYRAASFGGAAGDYVSFPVDPKFALTNWTIEARIMPTNGWLGGGTIISRQIDSGSMNYFVGVDSNLHIVAGFGRTVLTNLASTVDNSGTRWTHVAATYNTAGRVLRIYKDGVLGAMRSTTEGIRLAGAGALQQRIGNSFGGLVDDVRIWSSVLDESSLREGMSVVSSGFEAGLVAYYRFDDGTSYDLANGIGTSGVTNKPASWQVGQAQDYTASSGKDWLSRWVNGATFHGNSGFTNITAAESVALRDEDGDGIPDWWEIANGLNHQFVDDAWDDPDGDGLPNIAEYRALLELGVALDPNIPDSDYDGFSDYYSWDKRPVVMTNLFGYVSSNVVYRTYGEILTDNDGMPDAWELDNGLDPRVSDGQLHGDGDRWRNLTEYLAGTLPDDATSLPSPSISGRAIYAGTVVGGIRVTAYDRPNMDGTSLASVVANPVDGSFVLTGLREGNVYLMASVGAPAAGVPFGVPARNPIPLSWGSVTGVEIPISDQALMPWFQRFGWNAAAPRVVVTLYRYSVQVLQTTLVNRKYIFDYDYIAAGLPFGLREGFYEWRVQEAFGGQYPVLASGNFTVAPLTPSTPVLLSPAEGSQVLYAESNIRFTLPTGRASGIEFRIRPEASPTWTTLGSLPLPAINVGDLSYTLPIPVAFGTASWPNGRYQIALRAINGQMAGAMSATNGFLVNVQAPPVGQTRAAGSVVYFGKANGLSDLTNIVVQAYRSSGFSGFPVIQSTMAYHCSTSSPSIEKGSFEFLGLRQEPTLSFRAFIDANNDGQWQDWETMGFFAGADQKPAVVSLVATPVVTSLRIVMNDIDTDGDGLPDGWEWYHFGTLAQGAWYDPEGDGPALREYETTMFDSNPTLADTDGDGLVDCWIDANHNGKWDPGETAGETGDGIHSQSSYGSNPTLGDTDHDGVSDFTEVMLGLNANASDSDGDGMTDREEIIARTDGRNSSDLLEVASAVSGSGEGFVVEWAGKASVRYRVLYSDNLRSWHFLVEDFQTVDGVRRYVDGSVTGGNCRRFYRVEIVQ